MINFQTWYFHRIVNEVNVIIDQVNRFIKEETDPTGDLNTSNKAKVTASLPQLGYRGGPDGVLPYFEIEKNKSEAIRQCIIDAFKKERELQRKRGDDIRFPPGVVVNKINHRIFNYDIIQDKITEFVNSGTLDCCDAVDIRLALKDKLFQLGKNIIHTIRFPLELGDKVLEKREIEQTLLRFYKRDIDELQEERNKNDCGNCGGGRSSEKWGKPQQRQSRPQQQPQAVGGNRPLPPRGTRKLPPRGTRR